jgi:cyclophilin family peptidyl-prolyl cis-trans isomerase
MKNLILFFAILSLMSSCKSHNYKGLDDGLYAELQTNKGAILLYLYAENVPMTVANFVSLAEGTHTKVTDSIKGKPYFDGIRFHRVIKNFMIQSGDPTNTGRGNAGYKFADEFPIDSLGNLLYKHDDKGILSMANSGPKTNSSQFFITHKATPWLDRKHTVFGKIKVGQNTLDSIEKNDTIEKVSIIRVGKFAKNFKAPKVFEKELTNIILKEEKYLEKLKALKVAFLREKGRDKAMKTSSGLRILELKKGTGKKFNGALPASIHYAIYLASGKLIQSSEGKAPLQFVLNKNPMIAGVTEALKGMREGDKKRLFIPYYLGYGEKMYGPFPSKSDLVFEIELLKNNK